MGFWGLILFMGFSLNGFNGFLRFDFDECLGFDFGLWVSHWMGLTGFLRFDFDEGLITLMDFWGLILVYGFLIFFLVMNLWVSHWMGFNGFLEFDFDEGWIRVKNLSGLEKLMVMGLNNLCNLWSLADVLVVVWQRFCGSGGGFCGVSMSWQNWVWDVVIWDFELQWEWEEQPSF